MNNKRVLFLSFGIFLLFTNCALEQRTNQYSKPNIYKNSFFKFQVEIPQNWFVPSQEEADMIFETGKDLFAGTEAEKRLRMKRIKEKSYILLTASRYEPGTVVGYNPTITIVVESTSKFPGMKTAKEYLFMAKRMLMGAQIKHDFPDPDFKLEKVGGKDFYVMNVQMNFEGTIVKQTYFSTILDGFCFSIVITYLNDSDKADLDLIIKSAQFFI